MKNSAELKDNAELKYTELEEAFNIRDQYCCLQLLTSIVTSGSLQDQTSSIYASLSGHKMLQQILLNMFYIPNSIIDYKQTEVLAELLVNKSKGNLTLVSVDSSKAIMSDNYAKMLVEQSGNTRKSTQLISLTIGKAAYRCVFSDLNNTFDFGDISYLDNISLPNIEQSNSVTLAMLIIANDKILRANINSEKKESELAKLLSDIKIEKRLSEQNVPNKKFKNINIETSQKLAQLILAGDKVALINFVGQTMHHVTW